MMTPEKDYSKLFVSLVIVASVAWLALFGYLMTEDLSVKFAQEAER